MKKLRILFLAIVGIVFISATSFAVSAYAHGNKTVAMEFAIVAAVAIALPDPFTATSKAFAWGEPAGIAAFKRNAARMGLKTQGEIANIQAIDDTLYIRQQITSKDGILRLIDAATVKTKGITNIDKNRLPEGYNFAVEAISIAQGSHATITDPKQIANYTAVASSVEAEFRNSELVITQDSKELFRMAISSMLVQGAVVLGSRKDVAYSLRDNSFVLIENLPFEINIEFSAAMATASSSTSKFHVEVELFGKKTTRKYV